MSVRIEAHVEPIPGYRLIDRLGSGGFGEVWKCEAPGGIFKAVKIIHGDLRSRDNDLVRYAEQELKALKRVKQVRHPYLLALDRYDIVDGRLMIVMELADCNLWDRFRACRDLRLPGIPRDELLVYMAEVAEVLDLFNDQFQLQHLDIKPQNLFLLYNHVKVADFGQVKDLQGLMAEVTGGITPVYAAPETFDGVITRFCDQYSLACVYQELLTGVRPFDGGSLSQLLNQHMHLPPNLSPSPPGDRPALLRALAKKPEDRWPSVSAFVRALSGGASRSALHARLGASSAEVETPPRQAAATAGHAPLAPTAELVVEPVAEPGSHPGETPWVSEHAGPIFTPAPPEEAGPGSLQPALIIGLGQTGLRIIQRLRFDLAERYGPASVTPAVRALYIDTDPEALEQAARGKRRDRLEGLAPEEVFPARLNRATHYLKPRLNGRSLTEGWFDTQVLYRMPRTPQTLGLRLLGRLAFLDHYRPLMAKVQAELEAALAPDAMLQTEARTGLFRRTNRPRVYVVGSLAGGTGGGMFIDLAYAVRNRLKRMGYDHPEVVGLFLLPPADATLTPPQQLANAFAALTELNHYSRPDTLFIAHYDERNGFVKEKDAPFARCYLLPGPAPELLPSPAGATRTPPHLGAPGARGRSGVVAGPGSRIIPVPKPGSRVMPALGQPAPDPAATALALKPHGEAAERIHLDLFTPVGRAADEAREIREARELDEKTPARRPVGVFAFGLARFDWPRAEVVGRAALAVGRNVLRRWVAPDAKRFHDVMPNVAASRWARLGFDPDTVVSKLCARADLAAGAKVEELIDRATEPLVPRGWLARLPEPGQVSVALDALNRLIGPPVSPVKRPPSAAEEAMAKGAAELGAAFAAALHELLPALVDDPPFRLAGTEELFRQFLATADRLIDRHQQAVAHLDATAQAGFECLAQYAHYQKGMRKPAAAELTEALRQYPRARYQSLAQRCLVAAYQSVRESLAPRLAEVAAARQRLAGAVAEFPAGEPPEPPASSRRLMPPGCASVAEAAERFLGVLTEADLVEIDRRVQAVIEPEAGGLLGVCLNSSASLGGLAQVVFEEARAYLDVRLGEVGLAAMFAERFRTPRQAERAVEQAFEEAEPSWVGGGPWASSEVAVLACPGGESGAALREVARRAIPAAGLPVVDSRDDLTVYREWSDVPLAALPHLGPAGAAAYGAASELSQCSPHARLDVTRWLDVDAD